MKTIILFVLLIPSCLAFSTYAPTTVCEGLTPKHGSNKPKSHDTSPYSITVSSNSYQRNSELNITINGSLFHGFMVQARRENPNGPPYPIGTFKDPLPDKTSHVWCSGGEPTNTVSHKHPSKMNFTSVRLTWQAPAQGAGNISFYLTVVQRYDSFWAKLQSSIISGPAAPQPPNITLQENFQITKKGCGVMKGCYSEPLTCENSEDCSFLLTYEDTGDNVTFEMSSKLGYGAVGFNPKQEMNNTDAVFCSKMATNEVKIRSFFLDYHQPLRNDLRSSQDIIPLQRVYNNGIVKCRFSRKKSPREAKMRDLNTNWYFIFAWSKVSSTGEEQYHYKNASFSNATVDINKHRNLFDGRAPKPAPTTIPGKKLTTSECGKTQGCYFVPSDCTSSDNCDYLLTYQSDKTMVTFEMSAKTGWVAVGFNSKNKMDGTDAIICSRESSGSSVLVAHYNIYGYSSPTKNTQGSSNLKDSYGIHEGGILRCKVSRMLKQPGMMDLSEDVFLIFARGPTSGAKIVIHSHKSVTAQKVDVKSTGLLKTDEQNIALIQAHAMLLSIAWLVFASLGMFIARYMKPIYGDIFGKKGWFQLHRLLMVGTLLFTIIGIILAFVYAKGWTEADDAHPIIGMVVLLLVIIQPIMAFFRPGPGDDSRFLFNIAHRSVGLSALILAVINCFLGVLLPHFNIQKAGLNPLVIYCVGVALVLVFEMVLLFINKKSYQTNAAMKDGNVEMQTRKPPLCPVERYKGLKKLMFGFVVIVVCGCCLTLIILIGRGA